MRKIEDILVDSHKTMAASLHEAFEAGRAHAISDLKAKMASFFEGLAAESEAHVASQSAPHGDAPSSEQQHHHD